MYLQNKYTTYYYSIVNRARTRLLDKNIYIERHHVIPKSLGGSNDKTNIVRLTAHEHFVCHKLLVKMLPDGEGKHEMIMARYRMMHKSKNNQRHIVNSREYERARVEWARALSESRKGKPGQLRSAETRAKMSARRKGFVFSDESREKMRQSALGRKHSDATKEKFKTRSSNRLGTKHSEETKLKMSLAKTSKKT